MSESCKLTQKEADELLHMLKKSLVEAINFPSKNSSTEFDVQGTSKRDIFTVKIHRGKIRHNKYSIGARIKKDGVILLELHINPGNVHVNPDGEKIIGSHWHIYKEGYEHRYAFLATDITDDDFVKNTLLFFKKFNIIKEPEVRYQLELL